LLWNHQGRLHRTAFFLEVFEGDYTRGPETSIGVVNVTPHAQSSDSTKAPFHAMVHLARSDFDAALRLVDVTFDEGQLVSATLDVRSDQFDPEIERSGYPVLRIEDIDLSHGFQGFVFGFRVNGTPLQRIPPEQQPVRLPDKTHARKPAATISIVVSSVYIDYSMPSGYVSRLIYEGRRGVLRRDTKSASRTVPLHQPRRF
jgi:hypothetical protein